MTRNHYPACERADGHDCACGACAGALHGWVHAVALAEGEEASRLRYRETAAQKLEDADTRRKRRSQFRRPEAEAAVDLALADTISHLAAHDDDLRNVKSLAVLLGPLVDEAVSRALSGDAKRVRHGLAAHFWCELAAAIAQVVSRATELPDALSDVVAESLLRQRRETATYKHFPKARADLMDALDEALIRSLVSAALSRMLTLGLPIDQLLRTIRLVGLLICPSIERHPAVRRECLEPLFGPVISAEVQENLIMYLPKVW